MVCKSIAVFQRRYQIETAMMNDRGIYHERQMRELCALHALNNLFQGLKLQPFGPLVPPKYSKLIYYRFFVTTNTK